MAQDISTRGKNDYLKTEEEFVQMQKKWGASVVRPNRPTAKVKSGIRQFGGAIKLNIPIDGV